MEIGALLVAVSAVLLFSGWLVWVSCAFGWVLLAIAAIDYQHMILPDELTVPLIPAGLGIAYVLNPYDLGSHAIGVAAGFATFWLAALLYRWLRGREGLGLGDAKFLAASGAWVSLSGLPSVVFLGAVTALLVVLSATVAGRRFSAFDPVPFGSYLCLGTWLVWLFGPLLRS
jgi:leader peptidase (prepilin peptidase)/N-methyltransferase